MSEETKEYFEDWSLANIPPKGHPHVADFAFKLFDIARAEKERLGKPKDFYANYALYRGLSKHQKVNNLKNIITSSKSAMPINLFFANVERTVANITARNPTGEVVDIDGINDGSENIMSQRIRKWWQDTHQLIKVRQTARMMELYGITIEKPFWDKEQDQPDIMPTDAFTFFPAPGNWENISEEAPYIAYVYLDYVSRIEKLFGVQGVAAEDGYSLMGSAREDFKPQTGEQIIGNYALPITDLRAAYGTQVKPVERGIVIEVWLRDDREETVTEEIPLINQDTGEAVIDEMGNPVIVKTEIKRKVYPDGIRKITITKAKERKDSTSEYMVLDDSANPNINPNLPEEIAKNTYTWGRLPCYYVNSYRDEISIWGFSAAEQVSDLLQKINLIMTKLIAYVINVMAPPLIIQKHCGITKEMIENSIQKSGRLILMPTTPNCLIKFLAIPNLPETFFRVLDLIVRFFDRIYQIEDADRGVAPSGVIAASAIVALQERNQIIMQAKTSAIDHIVEQRSRWAIGLWQNFGTKIETVNVAGEQKEFVGADLATRKFSYVVESGSLSPRTSLQLQEVAMKLYGMRAIGRQGLLEAINWPHWKEEIERTAETELDQAFQILIAAGMPKEMALALRQQLLLPQGGPGDASQNQKVSAPKTV